jgi:hypothetical protein
VIYDTVFITGCDANCEWQLPWFLENYFKHNDTPLAFMDFGITAEAADLLSEYGVEIISFTSQNKGWFKKPRAIWEATNYLINGAVCWLDTDCQVTGDISGIFEHYVPQKIGMVADRPWTKRRPTNGTWYNSGVVLTDRNANLYNWVLKCESEPKEGDQEVLHNMTTEISRLSIVEPLPHTYNTLRLDYIDNINEENPLIIHHTGHKGKDKIREMMK